MFRNTIIAGAAVAAIAAASLAGTAQAASQGYATVEQCSSLSGTIHYHPGLKKAAQSVTETITGTIAGCSGQNGVQAGTGTFNATLSAPAASRDQNNESGTYVINWPAASGLNPSVGHLSTLGPNASLYIANGADTSGAYASGVFNTSWLVTGQTLGGVNLKKVVSETFVNTAPLTIKVNFG